MKPSLESLTPEQKRAMLARLLEQQQATCKTAFMLQAVYLNTLIQPAPVWNIRFTVRYFHKFEPELLRARMQRIVERHPALRTTYHLPPQHEADYRSRLMGIRTGAVKPCEINFDRLVEQRVHPSHALEFKVVEARDWSVEELRLALQQDAAEPYDLGRLPICRLRMYRRENEDVVQFDVHHIAMDLWSLEQVLAELEKPEEGPAPPSFAEFCAWQQAWFSLPKAEAMRQWWRQQLEGCPDLAFPQLTGKADSDSVSFQIGLELLTLARQHCKTYKVTLFNLLLSAYQVTLGHMMERDDLAVGGTIANRPDQRFDHSIGFFSHLVLYRRKLREVGSWSELWAQNRETIRDVFDRQFFPLTSTMPTPRTDFWLLFNQFRNAHWLEGSYGEDLGMRSGGVLDGPLGPWELVTVDLPYNTAPVLLEAFERKTEVEGLFRYRLECFDRETARRYVEEFQTRLRASLENPEACL